MVPSHGGVVTNLDYEKVSLFIAARGVFLCLVTLRFRVDFFFFLVVRLAVRLGPFDLRATRDVDRRLRLRPRPVILVPRF